MKLNVDRMRRYQARTTPDIAYFEFNRYEDPFYFAPYRQFIDHFRRKMQIKHGKKPMSINIEMMDQNNFASSIVTVRVEAVERRPNEGRTLQAG
jgi:hypothetical protein